MSGWNHISIHRLRVAVVMLVVLCGGLSACTLSPDLTETSSTTPPQFPDEAAEIRDILVSLSNMSSTDSNELAVAWEDLEADLHSVSADLERDPGSMELDGVVRRIESFRERFASSQTIESLTPAFDELVLKLSDVSERLGS